MALEIEDICKIYIYIFQPNKVFVRNDLFEKMIESCKATNFQNLKKN